jgi:hypothetical protein
MSITDILNDLKDPKVYLEENVDGDPQKSMFIIRGDGKEYRIPTTRIKMKVMKRNEEGIFEEVKEGE